MGKVSQQLVNNGGSEGQLSRISQHQQNKRAVRKTQKSNKGQEIKLEIIAIGSFYSENIDRYKFANVKI